MRRPLASGGESMRSMPNRFLVMVVEDDEEMNALEREFLEIHGLRTVPAYDGRQAMDAFARRPCDAVLLDVMLPHKDGFETCRELRRQAGMKIPIVMLTALEGPDYCRKGAEAGADAYFTKPFDPDEVVRKLLELLDRDGDALPEGDQP
jgi:two-component system, OmpR family, response regulator ResD